MSQNDRIERYLRTGRPLTKTIALRQFKSWRLGARIYDLRTTTNMNIMTTKNRVGDITYMYVGEKRRKRRK